MSEEECLRTSYENPEPDYLQGEVLYTLPMLFHEYSKSPGRRKLHVAQDVRLRLGSGRYLVPDMILFVGREPDERFPSTPPQITIEVLSHEDTMSAVTAKLDEFQHWGPPNIWLIDPQGKKLYKQSEQGLRVVATLSPPELDLEIRPSDLFTY